MNWTGFVAIILPLLASPSLACDCSPAVNFRGDDVTQYGMSEGSPQTLTSLSACFWISIPESYVLENHYATPLSYAVEGSKWGNEFTVMIKPQIVVFIKNQRFRTYVDVADGKLHHVCITWESSGILKTYMDGDMVKEMTNVKPKQEIPAGGTWVIGQDQDEVGGGFEIRDSFKGNLTEVNVWDRALCAYEVKRVAKDCGPIIKGNYKAYSNFTFSDSIEYSKQSCCPPEDDQLY